jgi:hypothetical protein
MVWWIGTRVPHYGMSRRREVLGVPGPIAAALQRYAARSADLERLGVAGADADALILEEVRATGGVPAEGDEINLTLWSERLDIRRDLLEALVLLAIHDHRSRRRDEARASAAAAEPIADLPAPASWEAMTPAPVAMRHPRVALD